MKRKTKLLIGAVAVVTVAGAAMARVAGGGEAVVDVRTAAVERLDLESMVRASGWIQPRVAVNVQSDIMGRVTALYVKEGDHVDRGQVLLRIDPTQYEAAVAQARAGVSEANAREAQARASRIQAEQALSRAREMRMRDSLLISRQQYEETETQAQVQVALHEAATHGVEIARARLSQAVDQLSKSVIRAPINGVVTRLSIEEGETAIVGTMNNPGSLLLTVSDMSVMETVVRVDETDVPEISLGDSAIVMIDALPRREFTGRITEIGHSSTMPPVSRGPTTQQSQAVDFEVVVTLDAPPPSLRPDLSATAEIITEQRPAAMAIPIIALTVRERKDLEVIEHEDDHAREAADELLTQTEDDVEGVFVIRDGRAAFTPVMVGITGREHFEILSGLSEGDSVVAGPYEAIRQLNDGALIRVLPGEGSTGPASTSE
ncbi:MAG TPA: efflux RND transporter periplasmic adaptor subunit [Longimicrobiales bacterium]|nr:efflux RND transporter periplasmic adaptor subunit [Longimicrobiales bacterium]